MEAIGVLLIIILLSPAFLITAHFLSYIFVGSQLLGKAAFRISETIIMALLPFLFLVSEDWGQTNDCCSDSSFFSPSHKPTAYCLILICLVAYYYASFKKTIGSPLGEILINSLLIIGITLNVVMCVHTKEPAFWVIGNLPIIMLLILQLIKNHHQIITVLKEQGISYHSHLERFAWSIITLNPFLKIPLLMFLCLPILFLLIAILLLVGQKPDSVIRMFTDTYKHGLSQLDYMCDNVQCGGHYLCSVAAKGNKKIVKPVRLGNRGGNLIICNRQLLISNAFEELLQERMPTLHKIIRKQYNKVGNYIHRYYGVFNIKAVSNTIYFLMKPLEWFFLAVLYLFDKKPENRIAMQYLSIKDRDAIRAATSNNSLFH